MVKQLGKPQMVRSVAAWQVGEAAVISLRRLLKPPEGERQLQVILRTEGPTRVLSVTDLQAQPPPTVNFHPSMHQLIIDFTASMLHHQSVGWNVFCANMRNLPALAADFK